MWIILFSACARRLPAPPVEPAPSGPEAPAEAASSEDAARQACVAQCVHDNQMRAVSAEQIEADCARACDGEPDLLAEPGLLAEPDEAADTP